ncbi:MAG: hypothetical protein LUC23_01575 [Prevotellaceae bacterium]|nr:hypothetical protein [Prevotellaceae bacterium]
MSHWQEWVVALVLLACAVRIGKRLYATFRASKEGRGACGCCAGSCHCDKMKEGKRENRYGQPGEKAVSTPACCCEEPAAETGTKPVSRCHDETAGKKHKCCCG